MNIKIAGEEIAMHGGSGGAAVPFYLGKLKPRHVRSLGIQPKARAKYVVRRDAYPEPGPAALCRLYEGVYTGSVARLVINEDFSVSRVWE